MYFMLAKIKLIKRIIKKISGLVLILTAITVWIIHTYDVKNASISANSNVLSRNKNRMGSKKRRKSYPT